MPKLVFVSGPPGSGKSTQAKLVAKEFGFAFFDTGDMVRHLLEEGTIENKGDMKKGLLMPIETVLVFAKKKLEKLIESGTPGIVVSGIPRSKEQAFGIDSEEGVISWLSSKYGKDDLIFINLKISEEESVKRTMQRKEVRVDDKAETLKTRLKVFRETTEPVYDELRNNGYKVVDIDGMHPIEEVFDSIKKHIK